MKFQHSAFIRRNTPELRKKLEELGYKKSFVDGDCLHCNKIDYCAFNHGGHLELSKKKKDEIIKKIIDGYTGTFDCGTNESLFLAIAAIREDSDYMQWFVDFKGRMFLCEYPDVMLCIEIPDHKASPKELEEHFKGSLFSYWNKEREV